MVVHHPVQRVVILIYKTVRSLLIKKNKLGRRAADLIKNLLSFVFFQSCCNAILVALCTLLYDRRLRVALFRPFDLIIVFLLCIT